MSGVVVTGAASGIGRASAEALVADGRTVVLWDIAPEVTAVAEHLGMPGTVVDVCVATAMRAAVDAADEALGGIDGLVHAAGRVAAEPVGAYTQESWDAVLDVNLRAEALLLRLLLPRLADGRRDLRESRSAAQHLRALRLPTPTLRLVGALDRGTGTQHTALEVFGPVGQPRRLVDRIADNRVFVAVFRADVACENRSGGHADAEVDQQQSQFVGQCPRGGQGRGRGIVDAQWRAEHGQRGVALELVDQSVALVDLRNHDAKKVVEDRGHLMRLARCR
jgi:hypothetical protein